MKVSEKKALQRAAKEVGNLSKLAKLVGVSRQYLWVCRKEDNRSISMEIAAAIEAATGGKVRRESINRKWRNHV